MPCIDQSFLLMSDPLVSFANIVCFCIEASWGKGDGSSDERTDRWSSHLLDMGSTLQGGGVKKIVEG